MNIILSVYLIAKALSEVNIETYRIMIYLNKQVGLDSLNLKTRLETKKRFIKLIEIEEDKYQSVGSEGLDCNTIICNRAYRYNKDSSLEYLGEIEEYPADCWIKNKNSLIIERYLDNVRREYSFERIVLADRTEKNVNYNLYERPFQNKKYSRLYSRLHSDTLVEGKLEISKLTVGHTTITCEYRKGNLEYIKIRRFERIVSIFEFDLEGNLAF